MPQAIHYVEERHRIHGIQRVALLCQECFDGLPADMQQNGTDRHGYRTIVRPYTGEPKECSDCGDDIAPELKPSVSA